MNDLLKKILSLDPTGTMLPLIVGASGSKEALKGPVELVGQATEFVGDTFTKAVLAFFNELGKSLTKMFVDYIKEFVIATGDIGAYFDYRPLLLTMQAIAAALLVVFASLEVLKRQASIFTGSQEKTISQIYGRTIIGGIGIYFLPWIIFNVFIPLNNLLISAFGYQGNYGKGAEWGNAVEGLDKFTTYFQSIINVGIGYQFVSFAIVISLGVFCFQAGIRFAQILLSILLAPIVAASYVINSDRLSAWLCETMSVVFTQAIQFLMLEMLLEVFTNVSTKGAFFRPLICFGLIVAMIKGPNVIRGFVFSTGVGNSAINGLGKSGSFATYKFILKK